MRKDHIIGAHSERHHRQDSAEHGSGLPGAGPAGNADRPYVRVHEYGLKGGEIQELRYHFALHKLGHAFTVGGGRVWHCPPA